MSFPRIGSADPSLPRVGTHGQAWAPLEGAEVAVAVQGKGGSAVTSYLLVELGLKVLLSPGLGHPKQGNFQYVLPALAAVGFWSGRAHEAALPQNLSVLWRSVILSL